MTTELQIASEGRRIRLKMLSPVDKREPVPYRGVRFDVEVEVNAGTFHARLERVFFLGDFMAVEPKLAALYETLVGEATLASTDDPVRLTFAGNGRGGIRVIGELGEDDGHFTRLLFEFSADQTFLPSVIAFVRQVIAECG